MHDRRRAAQSAGLVAVAAGLATMATVAFLTAFPTPAAAQRTVIIGGPAIIGSGASGIIVNNEVLESLGLSPEVPALPYQAPGGQAPGGQAPGGQAPGGGFGGAPVTPVTPGFLPNTVLGVSPGVSAAPGLAYRQPDTGQLLVTRPGRLLFPPPHTPRSRLAVATPEAPPGAPMATPERELTSRLLVPPPPTPPTPIEPAPVEPAPIEPVVETPMAIAEPPVPVEPKAAAPAPEPAPEPAPPPAPPLAPKAPEPQIAAQPEASLPEPSVPEPSLPEPIEDTATLPPPSTLTEELTQQPAPAEPSQETAAVTPATEAPATEAKAEPAPPPEPVVQPTAPPPEPPPPLTAPAPADTETEPPPPPAESLTSGPAVEPQTAALPPVLALAEQIRVLFKEGSVELGNDTKRKLSAVATALMENATVRIQLLAYAGASSDGTSRARRLSLSRALAVRAYLIQKGVRSTRMDVRALGDKIGDGPADRVDILPLAAN